MLCDTGHVNFAFDRVISRVELPILRSSTRSDN